MFIGILVISAKASAHGTKSSSMVPPFLAIAIASLRTNKICMHLRRRFDCNSEKPSCFRVIIITRRYGRLSKTRPHLSKAMSLRIQFPRFFFICRFPCASTWATPLVEPELSLNFKTSSARSPGKTHTKSSEAATADKFRACSKFPTQTDARAKD